MFLLDSTGLSGGLRRHTRSALASHLSWCAGLVSAGAEGDGFAPMNVLRSPSCNAGTRIRRKGGIGRQGAYAKRQASA